MCLLCVCVGGGMCVGKMDRRETEGARALGAPGEWHSPPDGAPTLAPPLLGSATLAG